MNKSEPTNMFSRRKKGETVISVPLDEPLTTDSCVKVTTELLKYILYQKQQIPVSCDALARMQNDVKQSDRNCASIKSFLGAIDTLSEELASQLHSDDCSLREIVIAIGATVVSPKLCVRLQLPATILSSRKHLEYEHSSRKPLLNLMRTFVNCEGFQEEMSEPLGPTNTFILVCKKDYNTVSKFFLPKPQYILPERVTSFRISFVEKDCISCNCKNLVKVYHDSSHAEQREECQNDLEVFQTQNPSEYSWFQSREVIKGFRYLR